MAAILQGWLFCLRLNFDEFFSGGRRNMDLQSLIIFLAIGAVAGWLAGLLMKGGGFGLIGNIIVGIIGAVVGGFVFGLLGISAGGLVGSIITATAGAVLLLFLIGLIKKA
jgi:uncharacterized membrane protein YeaQ/YmgE (transglycosylase-associated protein family)